MINGISLSTYSSNVLYQATLLQSIASCMTGISTNDITQLVVTTTTTSVSSNQRLLLGTLASTNNINANYVVNTNSPSVTYTSLSNQLSAAVAGGTFDDYLTNNAKLNGATGFVNCTSAAVTTQQISSSSSSSSSSTVVTYHNNILYIYLLLIYLFIIYYLFILDAIQLFK